MPHHVEFCIVEEMDNVSAPTGEEIIDAQYIVTFVNQPITQCRTNKTSTASNKNALRHGHTSQY